MARPSLVPASPVRRLARLRQHRIAPGEPDIRGWLVIAEDGHRAGRVRDIVVDVQTGIVRYIEVELELRLAASIAPRRIAIPIACAEVARHRNHVNLRGIESDELPYAPRLGARPLDHDEELAIRRFFLLEDAVGHVVEATTPLEEQRRFWGVRRRGREQHPYCRRAANDQGSFVLEEHASGLAGDAHSARQGGEPSGEM